MTYHLLGSDRERIAPSMIAFFVAMVVGADLGVTGATASQISGDTQLGGHGFLVVVLVSAGAAAIAAVLVGYLGDIYPPSNVMMVLMLEMGITTLAAAFASRSAVYAAARISSAMAEGAVLPVLFAILAGSHAPSSWPRTSSYVVGGLAVGLALGVAGGPAAEGLLTWRLAIGAAGAGGLMLAYPASRLPLPQDDDDDIEHPGFYGALISLRRSAPLPFLCLAAFIIGAGLLPLVQAVPRYLDETVALSGHAQAYLALALGGVGLAGAVAGGMFGQVRNPESERGQAFFAGYATVVAAIGVLGAAFTVPVWSVSIGLGLCAFATGFALPLLLQSAGLVLAPEIRTQGFALLLAAIPLGGIAGSYAVGLIPGPGARAELGVLAVAVAVGGVVVAATAAAEPEASDPFRVPARGNMEFIGALAGVLLLATFAVGPQAHLSAAPSSDSPDVSPSASTPGSPSPSHTASPSPTPGHSPSPSPSSSPSPSPSPSPSFVPPPSPQPSPSPSPCTLPTPVVGGPLPTCPPG